jgi:hypothetical protein
MTPYHMATMCGMPPGPKDATVAVRLCWTNSATSLGDMTICARWLIPISDLPDTAVLLHVQTSAPKVTAGALGDVLGESDSCADGASILSQHVHLGRDRPSVNVVAFRWKLVPGETIAETIATELPSRLRQRSDDLG